MAVAALVALPFLSTPSGAAETRSPAAPGTAPSRGDVPAGGEVLRSLRARAGDALVVGRTAGGEVRLLGSRRARPLATPRTPPAAPPSAAARDYLRRFGGALGLDADDGLVPADVLRSPGAGATVRFQQSVDGVPVLGGEVVVGLDRTGDLTTLGGETSETGTAGTRPDVGAEAAARTAVAATGRAHRVHEDALEAGPPQLWLYDPAVLGAGDPLGVRPVWRVEVSDGLAVRDLVLVDAVTGRLVVRMDQVNGIDRVVCDLRNVPVSGTEPDCRTGYVRTEAGGAGTDAEVEAAFHHAGATADLFQDVAGIDLTAFVGHDAGDGTRLRSTVRVCVSGEPCPWGNAFWNGRGMYYGAGFAAADDVVAHELTHGVVDKTAGLFYWYQSGALNESFADVFGEITDLRYGDDTGDRPWTVGEDSPVGAIRDMADPGRYGQPDRMTSADYAADARLWDHGGVHRNSGVGNKAAYLIAEGGTFNGYTIRGLDAGVRDKPKTAAIFWQALNLLTSAGDYQDLALALPQACRTLASAGTAGLVADDCVQVDKAVAATEMRLQPTSSDAAAPDAEKCPAPSYVTTTFAHDFEQPTDVWTSSRYGMWDGTPNEHLPAYATSGRRSMFGWDPDPETYGEPNDTWLMRSAVRVPTEGRAFLRFAHAYLFEWYDDGALGRRYVDGGRLEYSTDGGSTWTNAAHLPWVNGPEQYLTFGGSMPGGRGFGGDSHGYTSSRVDLSSLAGEVVRLRWRISADQRTSSGLGWWLDDIHLYTCRTLAPGAPELSLVHAGYGTVAVTWEPPAWPGSGVVGYRVTATPGQHTVDVHAGARVARLAGLEQGVDHRVSVRALNGDGDAGEPAVHRVVATRLTAEATNPVTYGPSRIVGRLAESGGAGLWGNIIRLYRQPASGGAWRYVGYTGGSRTGAYGFDVRPTAHMRYQVRFAGLNARFGSRSAAVLVKVRPQLTSNVTTTVARVGGSPAFHGQVYPPLRGELVRLQRQVGTRWRTVASRAVTRTGTYRFVLPTTTRGAFRYRAYLPGDAQRLPGISPVQGITVR